MIPKQTLVDFPLFANNGTKVSPDAAKYAEGYIAGEVLPAEHVNYFFNTNSDGQTKLNAGVASMEDELINVVEAGGAEPVEATNNQVLTAIQYLIAQAKAEAILAAHPIGSLYWSSRNDNPNTLFGGTWTQIKDKFVLAAGDTYTAGSADGGADSVTLTAQNMPSHNHSFTPSGTVSGHTHSVGAHSHGVGTLATSSEGSHFHKMLVYSGGKMNIGNIYGYSLLASNANINDGYAYAQNMTYGGGSIQYIESAGTHTHTITGSTANSSAFNSGSTTPTFTGTAGNTGNTGGGTAFSIMPPYTIKYCWERTA